MAGSIASLSQSIPLVLVKTPNPELLFNEQELTIVEGNKKQQEYRHKHTAGECHTNLYFGFFFDGTKNNYELADGSKSHSNVVRLYDCFPGNSAPGVLKNGSDWPDAKVTEYPHCFRTYIPGVSSPFSLVKDSGKGFEYDMGAAGGLYGERRIAWALIQAINNVHQFFFNSTLISSVESTRLACSLEMDRWYREEMFISKRSSDADETNKPYKATYEELAKLLGKLHRAVAQHQHAVGVRPAKCAPIIVDEIHISVFGFSRGSTQARAFTNWFLALCSLDAELCGRPSPSLGGFPVVFDFLGLFDTVASVGLANSFGDAWWGSWLDGHAGWADAENNLRVPDEVPCLHLVAAHEIRRSFPVDSIFHRGHMPSRGKEIVVPGVHSDIGSGYCPGEQGRGTDPIGRDMLARIPLFLMYKEAALAGVPLRYDAASPVARERYEISRDVIEAYNAYLDVCKVKEGTLTAIMREQAKLRIGYFKLRAGRGPTGTVNTESYKRASNFDKNDLHSAYDELVDEIGAFESWLSKQNVDALPDIQDAGFRSKEDEWKQIAKWWNAKEQVAPAVARLFDEYLHDSRAWFKLSLEPDNERDLRLKLDALVKKLESDERTYSLEGAHHTQLNSEERRIAEEYRKTKQIPDFKNHGREGWKYAGYLRYRKVYAGADNFPISKVTPAKPVIEAVLANRPGRRFTPNDNRDRHPVA